MIPPPYEPLVAPARLRPALWRLALGVVLIGLLWAGWSVAVMLGAGLAADDPALPGELVEGETPRAVLLLLATFLGLFVAPYAAARWLHARRPARLIGHRVRALRDFALAALAVAALYALSMAVWSLVYDSVPGLDPARWLALLPLALPLILVQTGAEELAFRGYLQSQLAARFASPLVWMVLPSVLFGLVHWDAAAPLFNAVTLVISAGLFGLVAAHLTARTGTLGAAWGMHFANNAFALLVLSTPGSLSGLGLRRAPYGGGEALPPGVVLSDLVLILALWAVLAAILPRLNAARGRPT